MAFAFVHLVAGWLGGKLWEAAGKVKLSRISWMLLLLGSILPDLDFLLEWTISPGFHRTFTHSLLFALIIFILSFFLFCNLGFRKKTEPVFALGLGILIHLLIDLISSQGIPLLWPYPADLSLLLGYSLTINPLKFALADMALGTAWLFYLSAKGRTGF